MRKVAGIHRIVFLGAAALMLFAEALGWRLSQEAMLFLLPVLVALAGLPHGALDPLVARKTGLWKKPMGLAAFLLAYVGILTAALGIWLLVPGISLALFLAYSAWHFAGDWRESLSAIGRLWPGLAIICLPAAGHPETVVTIYELLAGPSAAVFLVELSRWLAIPAVLGTVASVLVLSRREARSGFELLALLAAAWFLPPLAFFLLYFCGLHSPRHLLDAVQGLRASSALVTGVVFTGLAIGLGFLAYGFLPEASVEATVLRILFTGLAVLTLPHMILVEHAAHRKDRVSP